MRFRARPNRLKMISRPARHHSSLPNSARKSAIGRTLPKMSRTYGQPKPAKQQTTGTGTCNRPGEGEGDDQHHHPDRELRGAPAW